LQIAGGQVKCLLGAEKDLAMLVVELLEAFDLFRVRSGQVHEEALNG